MVLPEYVTVAEVKRVCQALAIRDWTMLADSEVWPAEAQAILGQLDTMGLKVDLENFRVGLEVELEHGLRFKQANVTNNHPLLTGKIVLAHLKEMLDYYERLAVAELEGDILKAVMARDFNRVGALHQKLIKARLALGQAEYGQLAAGE